MRLLRGLGLFIALTCLVWVGVLWHWQSTHRDMSGNDIVVYLGALPLTLFALGLLARWAWRGASERLAAKDAAAASQAAQPTAAAAPGAEEAARHATLQLLAAQLMCPAATSVDELLGATESGEPRPGLHEQLRDAQGLPVMCAHVKELDVDEVQQALLDLHAEQRRQQPDAAAPEPDGGLTRALALLEPPLSQAVNALAAWPERLLRPPREPGRPAPLLQHRVRVLAAWPTDWTTAEQALAQAWLSRQLHLLGDGLVDPEAWVLQTTPIGSGPELWLQAEHLLAALQREQIDDLVMLLACHSDIHAAAVNALDQADRLFSAHQPKGVMPGEAGAVLVLAGAAWPAATPEAPPVPHLHRAAVAQRDKPVDAAGRVSPELPAELLRQALAAARLAPAQAAGLADDGDQHSARATEVLGAMLAVLPELDAVDDQRMAGTLCGRSGATGTLMAVAMAAQAATVSTLPWAALSVADTRWRLALVARPKAPPPPEEPAQAPGASTGNQTTS